MRETLPIVTIQSLFKDLTSIQLDRQLTLIEVSQFYNKGERKIEKEHIIGSMHYSTVRVMKKFLYNLSQKTKPETLRQRPN